MKIFLTALLLAAAPAHAGFTFPPIKPPHGGGSHHTPTSIAEAGMRAAFLRYQADIQQASDNYNYKWEHGDQMSWDLAQESLEYEQMAADLLWWESVQLYATTVGLAAWGGLAHRVGLEMSAQSPATQGKIMGLLAVVVGLTTDVVNKNIASQIQYYKDMMQYQRIAMDARIKYLFWQQDFGGQGQPPPFELDDLFPGCLIETTCVPAWVCTTQGGVRDCEEQRVCSDRVVKC